MGILAALLMILITFVFLYLLVKFLYQAWWRPIHIQKIFRSQGIRGPPYQFIHGSTKEILNIAGEAKKGPLESTNIILPRVQPYIHLWTKKYGKTFLLWYGSRPQLFITEPELIKEVLINKDGVYMKTMPYQFLYTLFGNGLVFIEGSNWSKQRKLADHAFHMENLKGMVPTMVDCVEKLLEKWRNIENKEIEVLKEFDLLTSDVIAKTAFGSNYEEGQEIFGMLAKMGTIIVQSYNRIKLPFIGRFLNYNNEANRIERRIRKSILQIIKRRKEQMLTGKTNLYGSDYLGLLINANMDADINKRISLDDMVDECKTFYYAGHESTTSLLTWSTYLLAVHTDWQERARKEVFDLFGEKRPNTNDNKLARMKTMTMIVNETLRLYSPALMIGRQVLREVRLGKILLPPNIDVMIPPLVCQTDPQIWGEDVHLFKPDRFLEGVTKAAQNTTAFMPFGMGPRNCVGSNLSTMEVKVALSMILQDYAFTLSPSYVHSPVEHIAMRPQHGVQIVFHAL